MKVRWGQKGDSLAGHWQEVIPVAGDSMAGYGVDRHVFNPLVFPCCSSLPFYSCFSIVEVTLSHMGMQISASHPGSSQGQHRLQLLVVQFLRLKPITPASQLTGRPWVQPACRFFVSSTLLLMLHLSEVSVSLFPWNSTEPGTWTSW